MCIVYVCMCIVYVCMCVVNTVHFVCVPWCMLTCTRLHVLLLFLYVRVRGFWCVAFKSMCAACFLPPAVHFV